MSKPIQKINQLKKVDAFLQINYLKGHKFVDKAGEYLNSVYEVGDAVPQHAMSPNGMTIKFSDKREMKVTPNSVWVHLVEPNTFDEEKRELLRHANLVNDLIDPEKFTRVGWRNYLVHDCAVYPKVVPDEILHGGTFDELVFNKRIGKLDSRISVSFVVNQENQQKAVMFDVDIFRKSEVHKKDFANVVRTVGEIEDALRSDEFLELLNDILTYGQHTK